MGWDGMGWECLIVLVMPFLVEKLAVWVLCSVFFGGRARQEGNIFEGTFLLPDGRTGDTTALSG